MNRKVSFEFALMCCMMLIVIIGIYVVIVTALAGGATTGTLNLQTTNLRPIPKYRKAVKGRAGRLSKFYRENNTLKRLNTKLRLDTMTGEAVLDKNLHRMRVRHDGTEVLWFNGMRVIQKAYVGVATGTLDGMAFSRNMLNPTRNQMALYAGRARWKIKGATFEYSSGLADAGQSVEWKTLPKSGDWIVVGYNNIHIWNATMVVYPYMVPFGKDMGRKYVHARFTIASRINWIDKNGKVLAFMTAPNAFHSVPFTATIQGYLYVSSDKSKIYGIFRKSDALKHDIHRFDPTYQDGVNGYSGAYTDDLVSTATSKSNGISFSTFYDVGGGARYNTILTFTDLPNGIYSITVGVTPANFNGYTTFGTLYFGTLSKTDFTMPPYSIQDPANTDEPTWAYQKYNTVYWETGGALGASDVIQRATITDATIAKEIQFNLHNVVISNNKLSFLFWNVASGFHGINFYKITDTPVSYRPRLVIYGGNKIIGAYRIGNVPYIITGYDATGMPWNSAALYLLDGAGTYTRAASEAEAIIGNGSAAIYEAQLDQTLADGYDYKLVVGSVDEATRADVFDVRDMGSTRNLIASASAEIVSEINANDNSNTASLSADINTTQSMITNREQLRTDRIEWNNSIMETVNDATTSVILYGQSAYPYSGTFEVLEQRTNNDVGSIAPAVAGYNSSVAPWGGLEYQTSDADVNGVTVTTHYIKEVYTPDMASGQYTFTITQVVGSERYVDHFTTMHMAKDVTDTSDLATKANVAAIIAEVTSSRMIMKARAAIASTSKEMMGSVVHSMYNLQFGVGDTVATETTYLNHDGTQSVIVKLISYESTTGGSAPAVILDTTYTNMDTALQDAGISGDVISATW